MPQVPGTPSYGQGGWGISPRHPSDNRWLFEYIGLAGGAGLSVAGVGKIYKGIGLTSKAARFFWGALFSTAPGVIPPGVTPSDFGDQYSFFQEGPTRGFVADWSLISHSPGGGGPGHSLTSTATPPSVEEVGRMITSGGRSRKRCPTGMVWSPRHKKCILDITWGTDQYTRKRR